MLYSSPALDFSAILFVFMELEELLQQKKAYTSRILSLGAHMIGVFVLPIVIAWGVHKIWGINIILLMSCAFIFSWIWVIMIYYKTTRHLQQLDKKITELRKDMNNDSLDKVESDNTKL